MTDSIPQGSVPETIAHPSTLDSRTAPPSSEPQSVAAPTPDSQPLQDARDGRMGNASGLSGGAQDVVSLNQLETQVFSRNYENPEQARDAFHQLSPTQREQFASDPTMIGALKPGADARTLGPGLRALSESATLATPEARSEAQAFQSAEGQSPRNGPNRSDTLTPPTAQAPGGQGGNSLEEQMNRNLNGTVTTPHYMQI